jgi:hypothetical protein
MSRSMAASQLALTVRGTGGYNSPVTTMGVRRACRAGDSPGIPLAVCLNVLVVHQT